MLSSSPLQQDVWQWGLLAIAAMGIGITKSGFSGMGMIHVLIFAHVLGARESTGIVLPMLIAGDVFAILFYGKHANWSYIYRMIPPALIGICIGAWAMTWLDGTVYKPLIGGIILILVVLQTMRIWKPQWFNTVPQSKWFAR